MKTLEILVLAPAPTHPQDHGNRKRIHSVCAALKARGARIHYVHYPAEADWRERVPLETWREMANAWDSVHLVAPTRALHAASSGADHEIDEWWDPAIGQFLSWLFERQRFDAFIVNYAWLSKALEAAPQGVFRILDTHDRLSGRRALLEANGIAKEFFHTTAEGEKAALARADLVWAIKDAERAFFESLIDKPVITLAHADEVRPVGRAPSAADEDYLVVGCIGARNNVNCNNLRKFLSIALPVWRKHLAPVKVRIAGGMCDDLGDLRALSEVELMGRVEDADEFYAAVDVALIPMSFSTGLKIKAAEALAAGAAVVSHAHGFEGFEPVHACHRLDSFEAMAEACVELAFEPQRLAELRAASVTAQAQAREAVGKALDASLALVRRHTPRIVLALPREALVARSAAAAHLEQTAASLRGLAGLVFYCDFDLSPVEARQLTEVYGRIGPVVLARGRACPEGACLERATLAEVQAAWSVLALWLAAIPGELAADGPAIGVPVYVRSDAEALGIALPAELLRRALARCRRVTFVGADSLALARLAGARPDAAQMQVPFGALQPLGALEGWRAPPAPSGPRRILLLASAQYACLASAVADLAAASPRGAEITLVYSGDTRPAGIERPGGIRVTWHSLAEVNRDLSLIARRPDLLILADPADSTFTHLVESAQRSGVPTARAASRVRRAAPGFDAFSPMEFLSAVASALSDDPAPTNRHPLSPDALRFGSGAGWAPVWRSLTERRLLSQLNTF